jgi:hypothetical protein
VLGFYSRLYDESIKKIEEARELVEKRLGRPVSNPKLVEYMVDNLLQAEARETQKEFYRNLLQLAQMKSIEVPLDE